MKKTLTSTQLKNVNNLTLVNEIKLVVDELAKNQEENHKLTLYLKKINNENERRLQPETSVQGYGVVDANKILFRKILSGKTRCHYTSSKKNAVKNRQTHCTSHVNSELRTQVTINGQTDLFCAKHEKKIKEIIEKDEEDLAPHLMLMPFHTIPTTTAAIDINFHNFLNTSVHPLTAPVQLLTAHPSTSQGLPLFPFINNFDDIPMFSFETID